MILISLKTIEPTNELINECFIVKEKLLIEA